MTDVIRDIRFAARTLRRAPLFATLAVLTLAVGIGGTSALFSLVDAVVLRALPYQEPDRLVEIFGRDSARIGMRVPAPIVEALRERSKTIAAIGLHGPVAAVMRAAEGPIDMAGNRVSANFTGVMGVKPLLGRGFLPDEDRPGAPAVMLVSFNFWQRHLGGDPSAVGRTLQLDATPFTIVGIMPPEFRTDFRGRFRDYWSPHVMESTREQERRLGYEMVARLAPGVRLDDARREIEAIAASITGVEGWGAGGRRLGLHPLKQEVVGESAYALQLLLAAVALVLAMSCANLAQLLLARSDQRIAGFAIRKAMGARVTQLFRLALLESLMLSIAGGALGVILAVWLVPAILALAPSEIPRLDEAAIDTRVLMVAVGLAIVTGCAFGLAPALQLSRVSVIEAMTRTAGRATPRTARFRSALVVTQVAASVTLFALAGLVTQTFLALMPSHPGFEARSRTAFLLYVRPRVMSNAERLQRMQDLVRRLEALPGVSAVALAENIPFSGDSLSRAVRRADDIEGAGAPDASAPRADVRAVSTNLFQVLRMPLMRGRSFTPADTSESPHVAIVNQRLALRFAPGGDVLGRRVRVGNAPTSPTYEIVGVVADARSIGTSVEILNEVYVPFAQSTSGLTYLILQSPLDSAKLTAPIREAIRAAMPAVSLAPDRKAIAMDDLVRQSVAGPRLSATLMAAFCAIALLLAVIGLFGLVAYSVSQRQRELGIRTALGARPWDLVVTTMRSAVVLTVVGIGIGLSAGAYLTRFIEGQLYAIEPLDRPTFIGAALLMLAAAALAAFVPARRAVRIDPMSALRNE
jgi:putative ABC transport system permease protein